MTDTAGVYAADPILRTVQIGIDATHFKEHTPLGRYLIHRAYETRADALEELATVGVFETAKITELQNKAKVPDLFIQWIDEAIAAGINAEEIAEQLDATEGNY